MSGNYTRVLPKAVPVKLYGFNKVSPQDLNHIVMRLQKRTYNANQTNDPRLRKLGPSGRPMSSVCRKVDLDNEVYRRRPRTAVSPQMLYRINRRMQRSTVSRRAALGLLTPSYELDIDQRSISSASSSERPRTGSKEREKALNRLQRPTTATRRRQPCALLEENIQSGVADYYYSDEYFAPEDEIDEIVDRLTVTTVASRGREGDEEVCEKADFKGQRKQGQNLPLISGLGRSRNVDEITDRLYKPFQRTPAATQTTYK